MGGLSTVGLAGHRDTFLRPLRRIAPGMDIRVTDATGAYHYVVDSTEIVMPEEVEALSVRSRPELTLITCYPFNYVGAAPKRFIVHAHLVSVAPDAVAAMHTLYPDCLLDVVALANSTRLSLTENRIRGPLQRGDVGNRGTLKLIARRRAG